jgi:hypothetical protein
MIIFVRKEGKYSFWKKKGDMTWSNDVFGLAKIIKENQDSFFIQLGFKEGDDEK